MKKLILFWIVLLALLAIPSYATVTTKDEARSLVKLHCDVDQSAGTSACNDGSVLNMKVQNSNRNSRAYWDFDFKNITTPVLEAYWFFKYSDTVLADGTSDMRCYYGNTGFDTDLSWSNQPCGTTMGVAAGSCNSTYIVNDAWVITDGTTYYVNVTNIINNDADKNLTFTCIMNIENLDVNARDFRVYGKDGTNQAYLNLSCSGDCFTVPDTTSPSVKISINNTSPKYGSSINISANLSDETQLLNANLTYNMSGFLTKINFTSLSGLSAQINNLTTISSVRGSVINFTVYVTDTSNNVAQNSTLITIANTNSQLNSSSFTTSSGSSTLYNLQSILTVNNTIHDVDGSSDVSSVTINYIRPDGTTKASRSTTNTYPYYYNDTSTQADYVGVWTIQVQINEISKTSYINTTQFTVLGTTSPSVGTFYGYDTNTIPSSELITNLSSNSYNLVGISLSMSNFSNNWTNVKTAITSANTNNIKSFINFVFDNGTYDTTYKTNMCNFLQNNLTDLRISPYAETVSFILMEVNTSVPFSANYSNDFASCIITGTSNRFPIYSKNLQSTNLSSSYISFWSMPRFSASTATEFITNERDFLKNSTSLTRIHLSLPTNILNYSKMYNNNVLDKLRGVPIGSVNSSLNSSIAQINNGDIVIFNLNTVNQNHTILYNQSGGKDFWDFTGKNVLKRDNDGLQFNIEINATSANIIYIDDFDRITISNQTSTLLKSPTTSFQNQTYALNGAAGSFTIAGANDARAELWNPDYGFNNLAFVTYSILSYDLIINYSVYDKIIMAKTSTTNLPNETNLSLLVAENSGILDKVYGYISVADYTNNKADGTNETNCNTVNEWETNKSREANVWISNYTTNVFIDGFDIGFASVPHCFEQRIKRVADYIRIDKQKKAIFNTYTIYTSVANYGDVVMRESCFSRWDGADVNNPTYSYEDFSLMKTNADFMATHNKPVICMAFGEVNNYTKMYYDYLAFAVMYGTGNNNTFRYGQPNFQSQREIRVPNLGTMLETTYTNSSATDWTRKYSAGIVHINPVDHTAYVDDGTTVNQMQVCSKAQIYSAGVSDSTPITLNVNEENSQSITYSQIGSSQFDTAVVCKNFTSQYKTHGHYYVRYQSETRANPVGLNLFNKATNKTGVHSWYDNTANNPPTESQWIAYTRSGYPNDYSTNQWDTYLVVNKTTRTSIDTFNDISQSQINNSFRFNTTLFSIKSLNISIMSDIINTTLSTFTKIFYLQNGVKYNLTTVVNDSSCSTSNPNFGTTTINGNQHGACSYTDSNNRYYLRFLAPHLSTQEYGIQNLPSPVINSATLTNTHYKSSTISLSANVNSNDPRIAAVIVNGVQNYTTSYISDSDTTMNLLDMGEGNYSVYFSFNDSDNQRANTSSFTLSFDYTNPAITSLNNITLANNDANLSALFKDLYLFQVNFTENSTGSFVSHNSTNTQGNSTYHYIIDDSNLATNKVVGWKASASDLAGNYIESSMQTFSVTITPTGGSSGGASIYTSGAEAGTTVFAAQRSSEPCLSGYGYFEGKCYKCDGTLSKKDGVVVCTVCKSGFEMKEGKCVAKPLQLPYQSEVNSWIDSASERIAPENPMLGFLIITLSVGLIGTFIYNGYQRRKQNGKQ